MFTPRKRTKIERKEIPSVLIPVYLLYLNRNIVTTLNLVPKFILSSSHVSPSPSPPLRRVLVSERPRK